MPTPDSPEATEAPTAARSRNAPASSTSGGSPGSGLSESNPSENGQTRRDSPERVAAAQAATPSSGPSPEERPGGGEGAGAPGLWQRARAFGQRHLARLLVLPDLLVLYVAFLGGLKARFGVWTLPGEAGYGGALALALLVYPAALAVAGLYRTPPRAMHLPQFLRVAAGLLAGWAVFVALAYLTGRSRVPPRSVTALHCLLSMVGILGLRAVLRQALEWRRPGAASSTGASPTGAAPSPQAERSQRPLQMEDVLPREAVDVDTAALRDYLSGRTVLVTGAGGSIGTELTKQLLALKPFRLVLVDISEYNLFQLENALRSAPFDGELEFCIADVRDRAIMERLFADVQPDVTLHTAAYKHVPLMERHPAEAFRNNTLATTVLLDLSRQYDAEQFLFVSTDKAVEPRSVLGATKRLAEWYVRSYQRDVAGAPGHGKSGNGENGHGESGGGGGNASALRCKTVRFGNVFGSQGSVVPLFEKQLREDGAVRVTHPEMERYFMSANEACSLILQTLLMEGAPVYMFDMGAPVSIQWLAEEVVRRLRPGAAGDPARLVTHTGIRPGEKLSEKLSADGETARPTAHDRIRGLSSPVPHAHAALTEHFRRLEALCTERRGAALRKALLADDLLEGPREGPQQREEGLREEKPREEQRRAPGDLSQAA